MVHSTHNVMKIEQSLRVLDVLALELQTPLLLDWTMSVGEVIRKMQDGSVGYALITENDRLAGIFTERDVLLSVLGNDVVLTEPVSEYMTPEPVCIGAGDPVGKAVLLMHEGGYRQIPVLDAEGQVAGCLRAKNIVEYLVNHFAQHVLNLPPDPEQIARTPEGA